LPLALPNAQSALLGAGKCRRQAQSPFCRKNAHRQIRPLAAHKTDNSLVLLAIIRIGAFFRPTGLPLTCDKTRGGQDVNGIGHLLTGRQFGNSYTLEKPLL
jgi:hypothetical protein